MTIVEDRTATTRRRSVGRWGAVLATGAFVAAAAVAGVGPDAVTAGLTIVPRLGTGAGGTAASTPHVTAVHQGDRYDHAVVFTGTGLPRSTGEYRTSLRVWNEDSWRRGEPRPDGESVALVDFSGTVWGCEDPKRRIGCVAPEAGVLPPTVVDLRSARCGEVLHWQLFDDSWAVKRIDGSTTVTCVVKSGSTVSPTARQYGTAQQRPADQPPADQPPADQPPADQPPADQPPADQQPADQQPADPAGDQQPGDPQA